ncbi:hypothetical protein AOLI_G00080760 [Acnodon oligacanthus]
MSVFDYNATPVLINKGTDSLRMPLPRNVDIHLRSNTERRPHQSHAADQQRPVSDCPALSCHPAGRALERQTWGGNHLHTGATRFTIPATEHGANRTQACWRPRDAPTRF